MLTTLSASFCCYSASTARYPTPRTAAVTPLQPGAVEPFGTIGTCPILCGNFKPFLGLLNSGIF